MRLDNLCIPGEDRAKDIRIANGKIISVLPAGEVPPGEAPCGEIRAGGTPSGKIPGPHHSPSHPAEPTLSFDGALAFPGLINSHDHLDFNLFPPLGNRIYSNYTEWGRDIHANNPATIQAVLKVPQALRTQWGVYKNLLNGFTTVVNHGERLATDASLINVFQEYYCLHSVGFERNWRWKLNKPLAASMPVVLHVGEGTDAAAKQEIDRLIRWNLRRRPLVGIHGVGMNDRQAAHFRALVWCPASNYFLLDRTAPIDRLKQKVPVVFGTDSTLTAGWNSWAQIRMGRISQLASDRELLDMLTTTPAAVWGLTDRGALAAGRAADLVIARPNPGKRDTTNSDKRDTTNPDKRDTTNPGKRGAINPEPGTQHMDSFFKLDPEDLLLVLHEGNIRLFDHSLRSSLIAAGLIKEDFYQTHPGGKFVSGDLPGLMQEIRRYYPAVQFPTMP